MGVWKLSGNVSCQTCNGLLIDILTYFWFRNKSAILQAAAVSTVLLRQAVPSDELLNQSVLVNFNVYCIKKPRTLIVIGTLLIAWVLSVY